MTQPISLRPIFILAITSTLCASLVPALHAQPPTNMKRVSLDNGNISFLVPSDFHSLSAAQIAAKFPSSRPPKVVYADQTGGISIAVTFIGKLPDLSTAKSVFDKVLPRMTPGFHWIKDGYTTINHVTWIDLEFTTTAIDTNIHNNELITALPDKAVGINLNTTTKRYLKAARLFKIVKSSLTISP